MAEQQPTNDISLMTPEQAIVLLDQATQPGVKLTRTDYVVINHALVVLKKAISIPVSIPDVE